MDGVKLLASDMKRIRREPAASSREAAAFELWYIGAAATDVDWCDGGIPTKPAKSMWTVPATIGPGITFLGSAPWLLKSPRTPFFGV